MEDRAQAAEALLTRAKGLTGQEAFDHVLRALELCMQAAGGVSSAAEASRLGRRCKQIATYAEQLKSRLPSDPAQDILRRASRLHGNDFPPWSVEPFDFEFQLPAGAEPFSDPTRFSLSAIQSENFAGWIRPRELFGAGERRGEAEAFMSPRKPCDLVQDVTTDCSVVAGLSAAVEILIGKRPVLASLLYPFNRQQARPELSMSGKYVLRLNFNGCYRQVVIDDRLPASRSERKLFVVDRANPQLLWPALLEKAYLKVRGGYDFPGSNSGTDLWVLTGWIPEQIFLQKDDLDIDSVWTRIKAAHDTRNVVLTIGTGSIHDEEENATGLIGEHDYAIQSLDEVNGVRHLFVKNPWCSGPVWRGSWFSAPQAPTDHNAEGVHENNPAVWVTLADVVHNFESMYLNWNPKLFPHREDRHFVWDMAPKMLSSTVLRNPQFCITSPTGGRVLILASRHFVDAELEIARKPTTSMAAVSRQLGFMSILAFDSKGKRVAVAGRETYRGPYVDSPQTLARLDLSANKAYTVVLDQVEFPLNSYTFTLSTFSYSPVRLQVASEPLPNSKEIYGSWTRRTAGGNAACPTYSMNPQYKLLLSEASSLSILLATEDSETQVHVDLVWADGQRAMTVASKDLVATSGEYRRGCAIADSTRVEAGVYTLICATFDAGQLADFMLRVTSTISITIDPIPASAAGRLRTPLTPFRFTEQAPKMRARLSSGWLTRVSALVRVLPGLESRIPTLLVRISIFQGWFPDETVIAETGDGEFQEIRGALQTPEFNTEPERAHLQGLWLVIEGTGLGISRQALQVELLSESPIQIGEWETI